MAAAPNLQVYRIDNIEIDTNQACIRRDGKEVHLKPKSFRVLIYLLTHRDRVVPREELMDCFWKDTPVTDDALTQCVADLRRALGDNPRDPVYVKTIARVGFRFIGVLSDQAPEAKAEDIPRSSRPPFWIGLSALVAVSIGAAAWWAGVNHNPGSVPGRRQIALFRFENRSGQQELDWLRDGLPEMLVTTLARSRNLDVINRQEINARAARSTKSGTQAAVELARAAHAQVAIIGSFSRLGNSTRVDIQAYRTDTGSVLAADDITVERQEQLLTQVDFLALRLASRIAPPARDPDRRVLTSLMTDNLEAYRYYTLGMEKAETFQTDDAVALFQKAYALDPNFVMASARIGYAYSLSPDIAEGRPYLEKAFRMSDRLTEKDRRHIVAWYAIANQDYDTAIHRYSELITEYPNEVEAYFRLGSLLRGESRHEEAVDILRKGLALDPEDLGLVNALAAVYSEMGRHAEAISMANRYVALAPSTANAYDTLGLSYQLSGQFDQALDAYRKALELSVAISFARIHEQAVLGQTGRIRECVRIAQDFDRPGAAIRDRRRMWDQAAYFAWRAGLDQEARLLLQHAASLRIAGRADRNPAFLYFRSIAAPEESEEPRPGRGYRFGQRHLLYFDAERAHVTGRAEERLEDLRQSLRWKTSWGMMEPLEDALADAYLDSGRIDEAIAEYERALKVFPGMALAHFHLGQAYEKKRMSEAARSQWQAFLQLWKNADPELPNLSYARARIGR